MAYLCRDCPINSRAEDLPTWLSVCATFIVEATHTAVASCVPVPMLACADEGRHLAGCAPSRVLSERACCQDSSGRPDLHMHRGSHPMRERCESQEHKPKAAQRLVGPARESYGDEVGLFRRAGDRRRRESDAEWRRQAPVPFSAEPEPRAAGASGVRLLTSFHIAEPSMRHPADRHPCQCRAQP